MFQVDIESEAIEKKLRSMYWKVQRLGMRNIGTELSEWQTEDVHRKRPATKRNRRARTAQTMFRPHSRFEMRNRNKLYRKLERRAKKFGKKHALPVVAVPIKRWSKRPILRMQMLDRFHERMRELMSAKLKW